MNLLPPLPRFGISFPVVAGAGPLSMATLEWIISGPRDFQTMGGSRAMTALDELFEEIQSTWTTDGKRKQLLIQRSQLEQALLSEAVHQLKPGPILQQGEQYWFSLEDLLVSQDDQEATPKHRRIVALINRAIE